MRRLRRFCIRTYCNIALGVDSLVLLSGTNCIGLVQYKNHSISEQLSLCLQKSYAAAGLSSDLPQAPVKHRHGLFLHETDRGNVHASGLTSRGLFCPSIWFVTGVTGLPMMSRSVSDWVASELASGKGGGGGGGGGGVRCCRGASASHF